MNTNKEWSPDMEGVGLLSKLDAIAHDFHEGYDHVEDILIDVTQKLVEGVNLTDAEIIEMYNLKATLKYAMSCSGQALSKASRLQKDLESGKWKEWSIDKQTVDMNHIPNAVIPLGGPPPKLGWFKRLLYRIFT